MYVIDVVLFRSCMTVGGNDLCGDVSYAVILSFSVIDWSVEITRGGEKG